MDRASMIDAIVLPVVSEGATILDEGIALRAAPPSGGGCRHWGCLTARL